MTAHSVCQLLGRRAGAGWENSSSPPMLDTGWAVAVTATPTAAVWLADLGEDHRIEELTGYPIRSLPRLSREDGPHPDVDCYAVVPATANSVAKLALGIADNRALTQVCEATGARRPLVVVSPRVNTAHLAHPAWDQHLAALTEDGVHLMYCDDVWPPHHPGTSAGRQLPWQAIREAVHEVVGEQR